MTKGQGKGKTTVAPPPVVVRPDTELPDTRCAKDWAASLIKIRSVAGQPAIFFEQGAHDVLFLGTQPLPSHPGFPLVRIGSPDETDPTRCPARITFDRCLFLADPVYGGKRGLEANCGQLQVTRCHFDEFWYSQDSQAVGGWNGPGPFRIEDNYLAATGENILFGGADATNAMMLPANLVVLHNTLTKQLAWKGKPGATVKNAFELKACLTARIEENIIEYSWTSGQVGFLVLFTPRNQDGGAPFTQVQDVTFRYNVLRHAAGAWSLLGRDDLNPSKVTRNIWMEQNLVYAIDPWTWPGAGRCVQLLHGPQGVVVAHNTIVAAHHGSFLAMDQTADKAQLAMRDNVLYEGEYGCMTDNSSPGQASWEAGCTADSRFERNLISRGTERWLTYPGTNHFTAPGQPAVGPDYQLLPQYRGSALHRWRADWLQRGRRAGADGRDPLEGFRLRRSTVVGCLNNRRPTRFSSNSSRSKTRWTASAAGTSTTAGSRAGCWSACAPPRDQLSPERPAHDRRGHVESQHARTERPDAGRRRLSHGRRIQEGRAALRHLDRPPPESPADARGPDRIDAPAAGVAPDPVRGPRPCARREPDRSGGTPPRPETLRPSGAGRRRRVTRARAPERRHPRPGGTRVSQGRPVAVCRSVPIVRAASVMSASSSASASPMVKGSPPRFSAAST